MRERDCELTTIASPLCGLWLHDGRHARPRSPDRPNLVRRDRRPAGRVDRCRQPLELAGCRSGHQDAMQCRASRRSSGRAGRACTSRRVGQVDRGEPDEVALHVDVGQARLARLHPEPRDREQVVDRRRDGRRSGPRARPRTSSTCSWVPHLGQPLVHLQPQPLARDVARAAGGRRPAARSSPPARPPTRRRGTRPRPRRRAARRGRSRRRRCGPDCSPPSRLPAPRISRSFIATAMPAPRSECWAIVASRSCAVSVSGFSGG